MINELLYGRIYMANIISKIIEPTPDLLEAKQTPLESVAWKMGNGREDTFDPIW